MQGGCGGEGFCPAVGDVEGRGEGAEKAGGLLDGGMRFEGWRVLATVILCEFDVLMRDSRSVRRAFAWAKAVWRSGIVTVTESRGLGQD